jgi:hypothetical protein
MSAFTTALKPHPIVNPARQCHDARRTTATAGLLQNTCKNIGQMSRVRLECIYLLRRMFRIGPGNGRKESCDEEDQGRLHRADAPVAFKRATR